MLNMLFCLDAQQKLQFYFINFSETHSNFDNKKEKLTYENLYCTTISKQGDKHEIILSITYAGFSFFDPSINKTPPTSCAPSPTK